jgi:hypothetical protein
MPSTAPMRRARSAASCHTTASACITKILWTSTAASASARAWWLRGDRHPEFGYRGSAIYLWVGIIAQCFSPLPGRCPLWVRTGHPEHKQGRPLYPSKRTSTGRVEGAALCQKMGYAGRALPSGAREDTTQSEAAHAADPVIPENYIRTDSRGSAESAHDPMRCAWS